eukprot:Opistho-2@71414
MVRLTADLVVESPQYLNPIKDRELDLRSNKIAVIENLGATLDQFDAIDLTDNHIRKLEGFPMLLRLKTLFLSNNRIGKIDRDVATSIPNLEELILANNQLLELGDLLPLAKFSKLRSLCIMKNPVASQTYYRQYIVHNIPSLRLLDFKRIKQKDRAEAAKLFGGKKGQKLHEELGQKVSTFTPGEGLPTEAIKPVPTAAEVQKIKDAIAKATTLDEMRRLEQQLQTGQVPDASANGEGVGSDGVIVGRNGEEMEVDA